MDAIASREQTLSADLVQTIDSAIQWLNHHQHPEGFWAGMLESNVCMEAEWILAFYFLGVEHDPKTERLRKGILDEQREDGSWEIYHGAPAGDISATVEAYAALRACGMAPGDSPLAKARKWIFDHGGLNGIRVFTRYWLALIGEWPWEKTPNLPPEIIFFPRWFPFSIYNFASWARATLLPIAVLSARREVRPLPETRRLDELFPEGRAAFSYDLPPRSGRISWERVFRAADRLLHAYQRLGVTPGRRAARRACVKWIAAHQDADGAWGGIQPPWIYSLMALNAEGYAVDHPAIRKGLEALDAHWTFERNGALHVQASESPVWDTLLSLMALQDCGVEFRRSGAMQRGVEWILGQEVRTPGDWQQTVKGVEPGGWAFERANTWYPDVDDTAVALIVLARLRPQYPDRQRLEAAIERAANWLLAMQCRNGGWGAFDRDNDRAIITKIPFCDFGEVLDPPSVDLTAHVLEAFGALGVDRSHPAVDRGIRYILSEQEPDGCWFGRWGVNYIYGTGAVLCGLAAAGFDMSAACIARAGDWLQSCQNPDGGWGESCETYMDLRLRGKGESTPSQTAWAMMGLTALGADRYAPAVERGVGFLVDRQADGTWDEPQYTGTGFPGYGVGQRVDISDQGLSERLRQGSELSRGFMINYNMYRHYFPLMALGRAERLLADAGK